MIDMNKRSLNIVGISIVTSTEEAMKENTLGKLWGNFMQNPIKEKLGTLEQNEIFAVYSDYESDYTGKYKATIGYAVADPNNIPEGLTLTTLPAGHYKSFYPNSPQPMDVFATWQEIWAKDQELNRAYIADFEVYGENSVTIYVGVKS